MALDYDGASAGIFTRIGKLVKYINSHNADYATLIAESKAIADLYEAADYTRQIDGMYQLFDQLKAGVTALRQQLAGYANNTLLDQDSVLDELRITGPDIVTVLRELITRMNDDGEHVLNSTVTVGNVLNASGASRDGVAVVTKTLDGYNAPTLASPFAHTDWAGITSQMTVASETMTLECIADSYRDGMTIGGEYFAWRGQAAFQAYDEQGEGSGDGPTLTVANEGFSIIDDGSFENWGGSGNNTPADWDIDNGTAGTHIFRESGASNVYRGTYSLKFLGTGAAATIGVSQEIAAGTMQSRRMYCVSLRAKAGSVPAAGQIEVAFEGTGYSKTDPTPEVQTVQISGTPSGGTYILNYTGPYGGLQTTTTLAYNATSATVQAALRTLVGLESVVVTTSAGSPPDVTHTVTFHGVVGDVGQLTSTSSLTGGTPVITHATTTAGVAGDAVILPAAAFPTTFGLRHFFICTPEAIPSDWQLAVKVTGTLSNAVAVYIDSLAVAEVVYHGGVGVVVIGGSSGFVIGDRFTFTVANDVAGKLQTFFRRWFGVQLPTNASPSISDSLAT